MAKTLYSQLPVDSLYKVIKQNSIHSNKADWNKIDKAFKEKLAIAKNDIDSVKCLVYVFELMNDYHSQVTYNNKPYANYPSFSDSALKYLGPLVVKSQQQFGILKTALLKNSYVYIQVPGIQATGAYTNMYAQALADSICRYQHKNIKGFIIDLRLNSGGQLSSMVAGLHMLLGNGYLGGGVDISRTETRKFELVNNNFYIGNAAMTSIITKCTKSYERFPVAVIMGPATRSSGSITAIIFKGRPNTVFIGEPTADGYTTGNDYFYFENNLLLNLSTEFNQDRNGMVYKNSVTPDINTRGTDDFDELLKDSKIKAALNWMGNHK